MSHTEILSRRLLPSAVHTVLLSQAVYDIFYMSSGKKHRTVKLGNVQKDQYETVHRLGVYNSCLVIWVPYNYTNDITRELCQTFASNHIFSPSTSYTIK